MSIWPIIQASDILLWLIIAVNVMYVLIFAISALFPLHKKLSVVFSRQSSFLVLFPAYNEDTVIINSINSFLLQDYPQELYQVVVISDHMSTETNAQLSRLPITLLQPSFIKSSKAKALQSAMDAIESQYDYVVILDADNIVAPDYLSRLNTIAHPSIAIQCHRTAKNSNNDIAILDGLSEEINNAIFRKGHNNMRLSSALIGSGMCFDFHWFKTNVNKLTTAVEDRELEALLIKQGIYIHYAEDICVWDEKVSSNDNFQRQRQRWITGQVHTFFHMLPYIPKAIATGNINYIDKTIQQALIPRSILLVLTPFLCILSTTSYILHPTSYILPLGWWLLVICLFLAIFLAIPKQMRHQSVFQKLSSFPALVWEMALNILNIDRKNTDFIHTKHG